MADMRMCIGSAKFGIEAHEAPIEDFPSQPSQKDGLGRMCKTHWTEYTRALRRASTKPKAAPASVAEVDRAKADTAADKAQAAARVAAEAKKAPKPARIATASNGRRIRLPDAPDANVIKAAEEAGLI